MGAAKNSTSREIYKEVIYYFNFLLLCKKCYIVKKMLYCRNLLFLISLKQGYAGFFVADIIVAGIIVALKAGEKQNCSVNVKQYGLINFG